MATTLHKLTEFLELKTKIIKPLKMKLTKEQKFAVFTCVKDLQDLYELSGNNQDLQNLEFLKIVLNNIVLDINNIEVVADIIGIPNRKNK